MVLNFDIRPHRISFLRYLILSLGWILLSCHTYVIATPTILGGESKIVIPFEYHQGFIVVDVVFQNMLPLKFILDTGAENTILLKTAYAEVMKIPYHKKIHLLGSDMKQDVMAYISNGVFLQLANTKTIRHNIVVLETEHIYLEEFLGTKIDGILGAEFFKGLVIRIDYRRNQLTLYDPARFDDKKLNKYLAFDVEILSSKPYVNCSVEVMQGKKANVKLLLDTGAGLTALFHNDTDTLLELSGQVIKGNLGKGLGGSIEGYSGKIHSLRLGDLEFNNMISSFQSLNDIVIDAQDITKNGLIGNLLLERFDVIIDFTKHKLYLKPEKEYNKEFSFDKSGMSIFAFGENFNQYYVKYVVDNSPAAAVDIRPGDVILKVGCWSAKWYNLKRISRKFMGKAGKEITLTLQRDKEKIKRTIQLKDLFDPNATTLNQ